jgi:DHA1 family multidrug resistance protein-like MFS transporter
MFIFYQGRMGDMWKRVITFLVILFFVLLSDAVLSDWVPGYLQNILGSPFKMGLMMALSSVVGLLMDLIFPHVLRASGVRKLAGGAIVGSLIFLLSMFSSTWWSYALILAVGMSAWGVYYELDSFMTQQFVAGTAPRDQRSSVWGIVGVVRSLAYFCGPILGGYIASFGDRAVVIGSGGVLFIAYIMFLIMKLPQSTEAEVDIHGINLKEEISHWIVLGHRVWPILLVSLMGGLVDATFWSTGTVLNDTLAETHFAGGWFMSAYMLPFLFVGIIVAKWGVDTGKKKWAERFVIMGGLCLMALSYISNIWLILLAVMLAGTFLAMAWPLIDAVYTDLVARAHKGRKHIMGMSAATYSMAYVIGPILSGGLAGKYGELKNFAIIGGGVVIVGIVLLLTTPKKLMLPQVEMRDWE